MNRQQLANINRWLGWIAVPITFLAFYTRYIDNWKGSTNPTQLAAYTWINILVGVLPLVHAVISFIIFGLPRWNTGNQKVMHVWIGYITLLVILVSQSLAGTGIVYDVATILMYLIIVVHVVLGARHALARRSEADPMRELHRGAKAGPA